MMDREAATISVASDILDVIATLRKHNAPDDVIVKRIKALCKYKREQAELNIDMALDAMEKEMRLTK